MTMRWMHPPEVARKRAREAFDPVREGDRHGLSRDVSVAIWERVCAEIADGSGQRDLEQAQRRFHEIAALAAARSGTLLPGIGRYTRVGVELGGVPLAAWDRALLARPAPGRDTLVLREEAQRAAEASNQVASEARQEAAISTASRPDRDGRLPAAMRERMEQAYGERFDDVEIHADSAEVPAGQQAFTRGRHIYFERGAFDPESEHGEHVIAHELAHVAQQSQPANHDRRPASRAALEADAHQAALSALAGRAATVNRFAPSSAALAFSNGEEPQRPAVTPGAGDRPPAQGPRGADPVPSGGATPSGSSPVPSGSATPSGEAAHGALSAGPGGNGARSAAMPAARPAAAGPAGSAPPAVAASPRSATGDDLLMPEAPSALTPGAAGRLQTVRTDNQGVAAATTNLPTAQQQTDVARAAVVEPQAEQDAHAQHAVVTAVDDRPPPSPEIEQACARIRQVIRDKRPPSQDKLVDAKPREMAQAAGEEMSAGVEQRAGAVRQGYADMQQHPQGAPDTTPVPATLPPERAQTPPVDAAAGAPDPLKHDDVSLDGDVAAQQQKIQDAGMNTEPGQLVKDGPIGDARGGASDLQTMAKTDPQKVFADQAAAIAHAKGDMHALQAAAEKALADARAGAVAHMATHTTTVKGSEEQQRAAAGAQMQAIFRRTQQSVDTLLQPLSKNAVARWEAGVAQLSTDFESSLAEVKRKIDERHSGIGGWFVSGWDHLAGLPDWVTQDYDRAEARFGDGATGLITDISRDVNQIIDDCKKLIDQGRKDIDAIVHRLPASLQSWAQGEADRLGKQLDQLSQRVDQTQKGLNQDLVNRASGAVQTVRERVADLREQAKGLLGKIADAIVEFAKNPAKAIVDGLLRLLAIPPESFWALVDKLGNVVSGIAADPMKFANTLMAGVGQGFQQFFHNLPKHFVQSGIQWLFSNMGDAGIQMPLDFTMPSIVTLIFEILGITWPRIKMILAKHIGEKNVEVLDQAYQLISTLIARGPLGVYHLILPHLDPGMIMDSIKNAAISFVMETIITQVAMRIIMMLNPAGAVLQAIEAIYRVIKWVIDNAARIFTLIEAVVNGAAQILAGNVSGVANLVERALGLLMVPVIDLLAKILHLDGLAEKLKGVIMGLQSKIEQILDKVIGFIVDKARALWEAIKGRGKDKDDHDKDSKDKPIETRFEVPFDMKGESHRLIVTTGPKGKVEMASVLDDLPHKIEVAINRINATQPRPANADDRIGELNSLKASAERVLQDAKKLPPPATPASGAAAPAVPPGLETEAKNLINAIKRYAIKFDAHDIEDVLSGVFPAPEVGLYASFTSRPKLPDGHIREPQHSPGVQLAQTMSAALIDAGGEMNSVSPGTGDPFLTAGQNLSSAAQGGGGDLPAILIHEQTHRICGGPGKRVHGSEIAEALWKQLESEGYRKDQLVLKASGKLAVKPSDSHHVEHQDRVGKQVDPNSKQFRDAIVSQGKAAVRSVFEPAARQSRSATEIAVKDSVIDGPAADRNAKLAEFMRFSAQIWEGQLLKSVL